MLFLIKKSFKIILGVIASIAITALATVVGIKCKQHKDYKKFTNGFISENCHLSESNQLEEQSDGLNKSNQCTYTERLRNEFKEKFGENRELPKPVLQHIYNDILNKKTNENANNVNKLREKISTTKSFLNNSRLLDKKRESLKNVLESLERNLKLAENE